MHAVFVWICSMVSIALISTLGIMRHKQKASERTKHEGNIAGRHEFICRWHILLMLQSWHACRKTFEVYNLYWVDTDINFRFKCEIEWRVCERVFCFIKQSSFFIYFLLLTEEETRQNEMRKIRHEKIKLTLQSQRLRESIKYSAIELFGLPLELEGGGIYLRSSQKDTEYNSSEHISNVNIAQINS